MFLITIWIDNYFELVSVQGYKEMCTAKSDVTHCWVLYGNLFLNLMKSKEQTTVSYNKIKIV